MSGDPGSVSLSTKPMIAVAAVHLLNLLHDVLHLARIRDPRIVRKEFFVQALAGVWTLFGKMPRQELDSGFHRNESLGLGVKAPAIVVSLRPAAGSLTNRDRGQQAIIQPVTVGGTNVLIRVVGFGTMVCLKKRTEPAHPDVKLGRDRSRSHSHLRCRCMIDTPCGGTPQERCRCEGKPDNSATKSVKHPEAGIEAAPYARFRYSKDHNHADSLVRP